MSSPAPAPVPVAAIEPRQQTTSPEEAQPARSSLTFVVAMVAVFFLSLTIRLYFNFFTVHANCTFVGDASEYFREATALGTPAFWTASFWTHAAAVLFGTASQTVQATVHSQLSVLNELKVAGPVFPLFLLACFSLAGKAMDIQFWFVPVAVQCVLSSITCVLIALTANYTWNRKTGIISGVLAALYPAFIVSTGALYTETFTSFLFSGIALASATSILSKSRDNKNWTILGTLLAALQLTRPPAVILSLLSFPFLIWQRSRKSLMSGLLSLLLGFSFVLVPYVIVQKLAFNTTSLIVNRRASENLFMGNSSDTQGWIAMPFIWMPPEEKRTAYVAQSLLAHPKQTVQLFIDKAIRLTKFPSNDYHTQIGLFDFSKQVMFHQLILLFAAIGLALSLFVKPSIPGGTSLDRSKVQARFCLLTLAASNLVYIAFVSMPRYFYPAMPVVIMFAAAGILNLVGCFRLKDFKDNPLSAIFSLSILTTLLSAQSNYTVMLLKTGMVSSILIAQIIDCIARLVPFLFMTAVMYVLIRDTTTGARRAALATLGLVLLVTIPLACLPSRANGRPLETTFVLNRPGQSLSQIIEIEQLSNTETAAGAPYLLIDASGIKSLKGIEVIINGASIPPRFIPGLSMVRNFAGDNNSIGGAVHLQTEYLYNCMTKPARISNDDLRQWFILPIPPSVVMSTNKLQIEIKKTDYSTSTIFGEFARNKNDLLIPSLTMQSVEKAFCCVESPLSFGDPRFDTRAKIDSSIAASATESGKKAEKNGAKTEAIPNIRLIFSSNKDGIEKISEIALPDQQVESGHEGSVAATPDLTGYKPGQILLLHTRGQIKSLRGNPFPHMQIELFCDVAGKVIGYRSPWTPTFLTATNNWTKFDFVSPVPIGDLPGPITALRVVSTDGDPEQQLLLRAKRQTVFAVKDLNVELSRLPERPFDNEVRLY